MADEQRYGPSAAAVRTPDKPAFIEHDLTTSYVDFDARTDLIARGPRGAGGRRRRSVAIMLPNSVAFFEVWAAVAKLQGSVVLVNTHLKPDEVAYIVEDSAAKVLVDDLDLVDALVDDGFTNDVALGALRNAGRTGLLHVGHHGSAEGRRARHVRRVAGEAGAAGAGRALGLAARRRVSAVGSRPTTPVRAASSCRRSSSARPR